jgi:hypothetical protein
MPYYGDRLGRSEFNARVSDAAWRAGHNLWWSAWNSVPAASLPNDEVALTRYADLGRDTKAFRRIRDDALHGFVLCNDGRLYHPFLAELALAAWEERLAYRASRVSDRERLRRWREAKRLRAGTHPETPIETHPETSAETSAETPCRNGDETRFDRSKTGEDRRGEDRKDSKREDANASFARAGAAGRSRRFLKESGFDEWYNAYPLKVSKGDAEKAWTKALKIASFKELMDGLNNYKQNKPDDIAWAYPASWLNKKRWLDEPPNAGGIKHEPDRPNGPPPKPEELWPDLREARH